MYSPRSLLFLFTLCWLHNISLLDTVNAEDLHLCEGKWTNKPCSGDVSARIEGGPESPASPKVAKPVPTFEPSEPLAPRYELLRKIRKLSDEYQQKDGLAFSPTQLEGFKTLWLDRRRPYAECLEMYNQQVSKLIELNQAQEKNQLEAERNSIEAEKVRTLRRIR